jgi:adenylate cyclase
MNGTDEAGILAESALVGERAVAWLRIVVWMLLGVAFSGVEGRGDHSGHHHAWWHSGAIFGWLLFAIAVVWLLRRVKFTPHRARVWPVFFMLVDYGVFLTLQLTTEEPSQPLVTMATLAILVTFSIARFSTAHVVLGAVLASLGFIAEASIRRAASLNESVIVIAAYVCLAIVVGWANRRVHKMFIDVRRRDRLVRLLPTQVADQILALGGRALEPVQREVTILFSDLRDFTTMSQRMEPRAVLETLDEYFERISSVVKAHDGMVNKFLGDGMLAVWGVPHASEDHAVRAVAAALKMLEVLGVLNDERAARGLPALHMGVGVHTGIVAAGMLGGPDQAEYTVIGDAVNLASRIEGLTKKHGVDLLASEATWSRCGDAFSGERVGAELVKGRDEAVTVYRVRAPAIRSAP